MKTNLVDENVHRVNKTTSEMKSIIHTRQEHIVKERKRSTSIRERQRDIMMCQRPPNNG